MLSFNLRLIFKLTDRTMITRGEGMGDHKLSQESNLIVGQPCKGLNRALKLI